MRLLKLRIDGYRSVERLTFEAGPFTVLFGKNNVGKTTILEGLYLMFASPIDSQFGEGVVRSRSSLPWPSDMLEGSAGGLYVELEPGVAFDDEVCAALGTIFPAPPRRVAFSHATWVTDPYDYDGTGEASWSTDGLEVPGLHPLFLDWDVEGLHQRVDDAVEELADNCDWPWLERVSDPPNDVWRVHPDVRRLVHQLSSLATDLLPTFVDGAIRVSVNEPYYWGMSTKVNIEYIPHKPDGVNVELVGHGAARWIAAAVQIALHLMAEYPDLRNLRQQGVAGFSRHVLLIDEPEAHLHPSAVASVVHWCQRMVRYGFTVIAASHHEEFLREPRGVTYVSVKRDSDERTTARTLISTATPLLQELASEVGMHPATVLSLHRAILFVEGPLDHAVLDEYAGAALDAAGVTIVPIHGTRNLQGLVDGELTPRLGIKVGILTDATDPATMASKSNKKRSREEIWVTRLIKQFDDKGLAPPKPFGVPEDDLLFALPAEGIRQCFPALGPQFPGWLELREECRHALGKGPSDSVDWKLYADENYGLPLTTAGGVRSIIRDLDLAGIELPSIRGVVDEIVEWAKLEPTSATG